MFLILFVLQPFGISMMGGYKFWVVLGYGVVSSLALSISTYLFPALFPRYHSEKNWTLGRELLGTLGACLLIAIGNCFYTAWVFGSFILSWKGFLISLAWVAVLAPFPIVFFLMWNRNLQLVRNLKEATEINYALAKRENTQKEYIRTRNEEQIGEGRGEEEVAAAEEEEEEEEGKKEESAIVEEPVVETVVKEEESKSAVLGESLKLSAGLRHSISLNDSFRFSRELFGGDTDIMNRVIEQISVMSSYKTAVAFLSSKVELNEEKEAVNDFLELLKKYFNQSA